MIYFETPIELYRQDIHFLIIEEKDSLEECDEFIRKKTKCKDSLVAERRGDACVIPVIYNPGMSFIVTFFILEDTPYFKDTVAHEISHLCYEVFEYIGMPVSRDTNEAYAYLNGYITRLFYEKLHKEIEKRKKKSAKKL